MMRAGSIVLLIACALGACGGPSPTAERATPVLPADAHRCLTDERASFEVQGPLRPEPGDADAPDQTLIVAGREASAYLGFYDEAARAERSAHEQLEQAKQFDGVVDRYGKLTIIWVRGRGTDEAAEIESCALS
jgi:hypothetical protein